MSRSSLDEDRILSDRSTVRRGETLTAREREVVALVTEGLTDAEIADRMHVSPRTVQVHVRVALYKARLPNRVALAVAFVRGNLGVPS